MIREAMKDYKIEQNIIFIFNEIMKIINLEHEIMLQCTALHCDVPGIDSK